MMTRADVHQYRSCLYGDGLFETIAYRHAQLCYWSDHWERLELGLQRLAYPTLREDQVLSLLHARLADVTHDAVVRLSVTRQGVRGYRVDANANLIVDVQIFPFPKNRWHGRSIQVRWCTTQWAKQPLLAGIKHLNRLEQVMARSEWQDQSIEEGFVCDTDGYVISGTMSALLVRHGQRVLAADIRQTGIDSIARRVVMRHLPSLGYALSICPLTRTDIQYADEVLFMNAIQGVGFVSCLDGDEKQSNQLTNQLIPLFI